MVIGSGRFRVDATSGSIKAAIRGESRADRGGRTWGKREGPREVVLYAGGGDSSMVLKRFSCLIITMFKALIPSKESVRSIASRAIKSLTPLETMTSSVVSNIIPPPVLSTPIAWPCTFLFFSLIFSSDF